MEDEDEEEETQEDKKEEDGEGEEDEDEDEDEVEIANVDPKTINDSGFLQPNVPVFLWIQNTANSISLRMVSGASNINPLVKNVTNSNPARLPRC